MDEYKVEIKIHLDKILKDELEAQILRFARNYNLKIDLKMVKQSEVLRIISKYDNCIDVPTELCEKLESCKHCPKK